MEAEANRQEPEKMIAQRGEGGAKVREW